MLLFVIVGRNAGRVREYVAKLIVSLASQPPFDDAASMIVTKLVEA